MGKCNNVSLSGLGMVACDGVICSPYHTIYTQHYPISTLSSVTLLVLDLMGGSAFDDTTWRDGMVRWDDWDNRICE